MAKSDAILIFEDDVVFHPQLLERLEEITLPEDWGIFYLGCSHQRSPLPVGPGLVRAEYALDTHAFAVKAPYYRKIMAGLSRREGEACEHPRASDWFLANLHKEIPTYACYPNLAWQSHNPSDLIGAAYSNYTPNGEQRSCPHVMAGLQAEMWKVSPWQHSEPEEKEEEQRPAEPPSPKLGVLFLTRGDVCHPEIWREFATAAGTDIRIFSHPKSRTEAEQGFLSGSVIGEAHETAWGDISLVRAMLALLREGLKDETLTHFAFASETCVPVKPWTEIRRRLRIDPRSMIHFDDCNSMKPLHRDRIQKVRDLPQGCWRIHPQWMLLDREAAACILEHDVSERFANMSVPDEHYFGSILALRGFPEWEKIHRQHVTWVKWKEDSLHPMELIHTSPQLATELTDFPGFFARKFPAESDVGKWALHRD
ncbi:beta-1,6-N-acetylglucosaminyltransferase [Luteolibacter luteus]|uniref:Beta-1,6-N-acetylglucosaminyltransferase n=1 Tax=Luteolibacter luteus TaxID=2728835 RepID=A0A858RJ47_9BACT|nr:beta-1,6-N-acetylglucosaminyltransferase [Luteolibacter luteus]QJE96937.1 beta-1,6-N-acetylglucosaminyltransferase [Luteolibacter luteus]